MNYKSQTININFIFILHYYIISSVALNVFRFAQLISKNDRPKPPKSGYQNADVSRKGGCDFWGLKAPYQPKLRSVEIVPSKNNVEPLEEVDFNLLFLKTFCAKQRRVISLRDTYRSKSFQRKPILSRQASLILLITRIYKRGLMRQ